MISFNTPKGLGYPIGTIIRQFSYSQVNTLRIVGFNVGDQTILNSGDIDLVSMSATLAGLDIRFDDLDSYPCVKTVSVSDVLTVGDLRSYGIEVTNFEDNHILLDTMGSANISFILNKCNNFISSDNNRNLLQTLGINISGYNIISSRSLDFKMSVDVKQALDNDIVSFDIDSDESIRILKESIESINAVFNEIYSKIS